MPIEPDSPAVSSPRLPLAAAADDTVLIARILGGEQTYFELLIRRYNSVLYKVGRSYGFTHDTVQDLMQDTYVAAYQALGQFEERASFKTWLIRIMLNNCYHGRRAAARQPQPMPATTDTAGASGPPSVSATDGQQEIINRELGAVLEQCIQTLPPNYRLVFVLRELEGLSSQETAKAVGTTETNVNARLSRAKSLLRRKLESWYPQASVYEFNLIYCDEMVARVFGRLSAPPRVSA
ncbi:sigma-70 family RNA polymerase sigma factor [Hymenobacter sp. ISL-91]|uniref:sigma-70 family RNA polymerase sigma factor n=1 Tax=Hymenobacter sp. ISL-91 TaxID=2819151 RepID=UPI001BEC7B16|nr:sigma-70 family RNA polymerase sigma factor [Hymenobacter sp. ISL-91]MBT2559190.1 sigma-70 family RNA polymerase sigma factor [Hymenobacter sp. ISL-91]